MHLLSTRAPAKINLSLAVTGRRADGLHDLSSLVAFARFGDQLTLQPGPNLCLTVNGPYAGLAGPPGDNLVLVAARQFASRLPGARLGAFHLVKRIPVAAGLGGGSADAAAALRLLAQANHLAPGDERVIAAAAATGADVPVCLAARPRFMSGTGAELGPALPLPPLFAVLVNPRLAVETRAVFAAMALSPGQPALASRTPVIPGNYTAASLIAALKRAGNDMEDAACVLAPVIVPVLAVLAAARGARLSRMSGSGATCFALFDDCRAASRAARSIALGYPGWWVKASVVG